MIDPEEALYALDMVSVKGSGEIAEIEGRVAFKAADFQSLLVAFVTMAADTELTAIAEWLAANAIIENHEDSVFAYWDDLDYPAL